MPKFIRFFGGPLDGHRQDFSERIEPLSTVLHLEVSHNTSRQLANQPMKSDEATTSRATYELRDDRYCFVSAR